MQYCTVAYIAGIILRTRNSSGDETANENFLYGDIIHTLQNTIDSCINSATYRRGSDMLEHSFTKFSEITQCYGHYAIQGHSRSPILINTQLASLLHRFRDTDTLTNSY